MLADWSANAHAPEDATRQTSSAVGNVVGVLEALCARGDDPWPQSGRCVPAYTINTGAKPPPGVRKLVVWP